MSGKQLNSSLDLIIPPEVWNDDFYSAIVELAKNHEIYTVLEIGSSSGAGSTQAWVDGLKCNPNKVSLFCLEVSKARFAELEKRYSAEDFVNCYNYSSVGPEDLPSAEEVTDFYWNSDSSLRQYPLESVLEWLDQDIAYINRTDINTNGIEKIKQENEIHYFDAVLIDGSEFTGYGELLKIYGAKYILLDDVNTFKCHQARLHLLNGSEYELMYENLKTRNGFSIFRKISSFNGVTFTAEKKEILLTNRLIKNGLTVFDVGANLGDYSLLFSNIVGGTGSVYCFEPTSSIFNDLQERIKKNLALNVFAYQQAMYSEEGTIEFNQFSDEFSVWNSIGQPKMLNPNNPSELVQIERKEIVPTNTIDNFCSQHNIPKIHYLKVDVEGAEADVLQGAKNLLASKSIDFLQFEISKNMLDGMNRQARETFEILLKYDYECHCITEEGGIGDEVFDSNSFYENYIAFPRMKVDFFTIVLNGEPFIRYHIDQFNQLPFDWHWHIIEGVAALKHDTAWSVRNGGIIPDHLHENGLSNDGTTDYLNELAELYPSKVTIYRKPYGEFWDGKLEMVNAPLKNIRNECLLWQIDADELWTVEQICNVRQMFIEDPAKTAAYYWCSYFVGEYLMISSRNCYAQNPNQDWLRTWKYKPGMLWAAHEPPILAQQIGDQKVNVAAINPFLHAETEAYGAVFQHYAYVTPDQLAFKESYYGYKGAVEQWSKLQSNHCFPDLLRKYFPWVGDNTTVDLAERCGIIPIAQKDPQNQSWSFLNQNQLNNLARKLQSPKPLIIVDGVFFQYYQTGIARVWRSLLEQWSKTDFSRNIIVLDRAGTTPQIPGIRYRTIPNHNYNDNASDRAMLQQICDEEGADIFISSYYTIPESTPSVFMAYDMIPEIIGADLQQSMWQDKHRAIEHASSFITISESTAQDLSKFFPSISPESITVAHCGVSEKLGIASTQDISHFKHKYGIRKPYFLLVGVGFAQANGYKNGGLFFQAFAKSLNSQDFDIVCTGGGSLDLQLRQYTGGSTVHMLHLDDDELRLAYAGAVALVFPSLYEGFGMPVVEAMACGCPVITCPNSSIPEVAGEAALYVNETDIIQMADALCEVQKPSVREKLIQAGFQQAQKFSWSGMAEKVSIALLEATLIPLKLREVNYIICPDWSQPEETIAESLEQALGMVASSSDKEQTTLLICLEDVDAEAADLVVSSAAMSLLMNGDLDISEGPEISLLGQLSNLQWQTLLPKLKGRLPFINENQLLVGNKLASLPTVELSYQEVIV